MTDRIGKFPANESFSARLENITVDERSSSRTNSHSYQSEKKINASKKNLSSR